MEQKDNGNRFLTEIFLPSVITRTVITTEYSNHGKYLITTDDNQYIIVCNSEGKVITQYHDGAVLVPTMGRNRGVKIVYPNKEQKGKWLTDNYRGLQNIEVDYGVTNKQGPDKDLIDYALRALADRDFAHDIVSRLKDLDLAVLQSDLLAIIKQGKVETNLNKYLFPLNRSPLWPGKRLIKDPPSQNPVSFSDNPILRIPLETHLDRKNMDLFLRLLINATTNTAEAGGDPKNMILATNFTESRSNEPNMVMVASPTKIEFDQFNQLGLFGASKKGKGRGMGLALLSIEALKT